MPLTKRQAEVLEVISANRSPESHVAGGMALNYEAKAARFSADIDIFHDAEEGVIEASEVDLKSLQAAGFETKRSPVWSPTFRRAFAEKEGDRVKIEWARDSAFRFFPIERVPILQWRLHPLDALTDKALTMAGREETRDMVDLVSYAPDYPLAAVIWAACAKDPGYNPLQLLTQMQRHTRIDVAALKELQVLQSPVELKQRWISLSDEAESLIQTAATAGVEPGVVFLLPNFAVGWHTDPHTQPHYATLGGVVPRIS